MKKLISIIIATYNAEKSLKQCLQSIVSQKTSSIELIIIDGASKDNTRIIIDEYKNHIDYCLSESDKGIYDAWNKGIEKAKGEWITFLGADDILLPNALNHYLNLLKQHEFNYDYICAHNEYVDKNGKLLKILGEPARWKTLRKRMSAAHVGSLHNKKLFKEYGLYDLQYKICADYEFLLRKREKIKIYFLPKKIARMYVGGMSFSNISIKETYLIRQAHSTVSPFTNQILYRRDQLFFLFFKLRKRVSGHSLLL